MRLVAGVLSLALFAPIARAEDPATPPPAPSQAPPAPAPAPSSARVSLRVVRVMPETRQALLFDRARNTHVLVEVGGQIAGYVVEDIDDDTVSLRRDNQQVVLAAPLHHTERAPVGAWSASAAPLPASPPPVAAGPAVGPVDPYGPPAADALPPDPGIRVAHAGGQGPGSPAAQAVVAGEGGVRVAEAPDVGPAAAPGSSGPTSAPGAAGPSAIRVVSASLGPAPAAPPPAGPGAPPAAPVAASPAAMAPGAAPVAARPAVLAANAGPVVPGAATAGPAASPAAPGASAPTALGREVDEPISTLPRRAEPALAPAPRSDAARAPDKQTADALAMADILAADHPTRAPRGPAELTAPPHPAAVPSSVPAPVPGDAVAIPRGELDGALADFGRLTAGVHGSFSASGVVIDGVGDGTIFQRAGLRTGDVVTSVDGVRLRTLDDAANLYARAATARAITAQVVRAGKPVTLHVVIQ